MKKTLIILLIGLAGLWGGHAYLGNRLEGAFHQFVKAQESVGVTVSYDSMSRSIIPLGAKFVLKSPSFQSQNSWLQKAAVKGDLTIKISFLSSKPVRFFTSDETTLSWKSPDPETPFSATVKELKGETSLNDYHRLDTTEIVYGEAFIRTAHDQAPLLRTSGGGVKFSKAYEKKEFQIELHAEPLYMPGTLTSPFGTQITDFLFKATVTDLEEGETFKDSIQDWYDASGTVEIEKLRFKWGSLDVDSQGTLSLDENLQPIVALSAEVKDIKTVLNTLVEEKIISKKSVNLIDLVLGALTQVTEGETRHKFALTLQDGELSIGPIPLIQGLRVDWG